MWRADEVEVAVIISNKAVGKSLTKKMRFLQDLRGQRLDFSNIWASVASVEGQVCLGPLMGNMAGEAGAQ